MKRIASIDILRSFTMLLMLWVNDFAHMDGIPRWMLHAPTRVDMLGLSDLAFPSFLFCMGMSVPFAIENRLGKGDGLLKTFGHVLLRSLSLIALGLMELNSSGSLFKLVLGVAIFLVWTDCGHERKTFRWILTAIGLAALVWLAISVWPIHTGWWGILGLIGWSYLLCAVLYLAFRKVPFSMPVLWVLVIAMVILDHSGIKHVPDYPGGWVHSGLAFTGLLCSCVARWSAGKEKSFPLFMLGGAVLMAAGFLVSHKFWIISKNMGTPTWMFLSLTIDMVLLAGIYYIADIRKHVAWASPIRAAGTSTFTCYCLPFIICPLMDFLGLWLPDSIRSGLSGLALALLFAFIVILIAELLSRIKVRLKL